MKTAPGSGKVTLSIPNTTEAWQIYSPMAKRYWLMKSEPSTYSIADLERDETTQWEGIRNYQARNFMRDEMKLVDGVLFYHSNTKPPGVVGTALVCRESYPDHFAFDTSSAYYDPKSRPDTPRWMMVDVQYQSTFKRLVSLEELKSATGLEEMLVIRKGQRLSIQPVSKAEFLLVKKLGRKKAP